MKKYLLFVMSMLVLVTNVKAGVTLSDSNPYFILTATDAGDIASGWASLDWPSYTNERIGLKIVGPVNDADITALHNFDKTLSTANGIIDFSGATLGSVIISSLSDKFTILRVPQTYSLVNNDLPSTISFAFSTDATRQRWWSGDAENSVLNISVNSGGLSKAKTFFTSDTYGYNGYLNYRSVNLMGPFSSSDLTSFTSGFETEMEPIITRIYNQPVNIDDCNVILNMNKKASNTFSDLLSNAKSSLGETSICTLTILGAMVAEDISALNTAMGSSGNLSAITRLDLSEATGFDQSAVDGLAVPSTIVSLVIPAGMAVSSTLESAVSDKANLEYIYSPTTSTQDASQSVADVVWVAISGGLEKAFINEEKLRSGIYVKVQTKNASDPNHANRIQLNTDDVDFSLANIGNQVSFQYLDASGAYITLENAANFKAPHNNSYRVILPDGTTADQLAAFASNPNVSNVAAAYSYSEEGGVHTLNILEIVDASYAQTALHDSRIVRSGTTAIDVVTGSTTSGTKGQFGPNLLAAINEMSSEITSVSISTVSAPNALRFTNTNITHLDLEGITNTSSALDITGTHITDLSVKNATLASINASGQIYLRTANFEGTTVTGSANFSGCSSLSAATDNSITNYQGELNLAGTAFTSFTPKARIGGNIVLTGANNLTSVNLTEAKFQNTTSTVNVESSTDSGEYIAKLLHKTGENVDKSITIPTDFATSRIIPSSTSHQAGEETSENQVQLSNLINVLAPIAEAVTLSSTTMALHEKESGDNYIYWYSVEAVSNKEATVNTNNSRSLKTIMESSTEPNLSSDEVYTKVKIVGPLTSTDVTSNLSLINTQVLDLSQAVVDNETLKSYFASHALHENVKFLILPSGSTREDLINATDLAGLYNSTTGVGVYCALATEETVDGPYITSYNFVPGTLQPATVLVMANNSSVWSRTTNQSTKQVFTTNQTDKVGGVKLSGVLNAFDLAKSYNGSSGLILSDNGHLEWNEPVTEGPEASQTRTLKTGNVTVYGTFSTWNIVYEIDLEGATFEEGYVSDMTLSYLGIVAAQTRKVVIPTSPTVTEIPADFMRDVTHIRAICIPSNIEIIRTRAFKSIDYVWTTPNRTWDATNNKWIYNDPEGSNTRLDNGIQYSADDEVVYATEDASLSYIQVPYAGSYTFSSNVKVIETAAFANTQPHVKDVYVLNTVAPECHVDAFNTKMYLGNGGYSPVITEGIITRDSYKNGDGWITMLHYPRQTTTPNVQRYTDPTRSYSISTGYRDGKGNMLYFPNQSEFIRAYAQGQNGYTWNAWDPTRQYGSVNNGTFTNVSLDPYNTSSQTNANTNYTNYTTGGANHVYTSFYDVTVSGSKPSDLVDYYNIYWDESAYSTSGSDDDHLYPQNKDYRGWHQFVLNAYAANTIVDEEPYRSFINDNDWWTICPTFDMSKADIIEIFGTAGGSTLPYVSRLLYVRREYDPDNNNVIYLNFSDNLMEKKENRVGDAQHGTLDADGVVTISGNVESSDIVMKAGVPYLIKPYLPSGDKRLFRVYTTESWGLLSSELKAQANSEVKVIVDNDLYVRMHAAVNQDGGTQISLVENGKYTVPVFFKGTAATDITVEGAVSGFTPSSNFTGYQKSADWKYTFVGSFYQSYLPAYSYSLGKKNGKVSFLWNRVMDQNNMRWINETGIICPTKAEFTSTITRASAGEPAQWKLFTGSNNAKVSILNDDSFVVGSGSGARQYKMVFGSDDMSGEDVTGIHDLNDANSEMTNNASLKVYSLGGMYKGNSLNGLSKGVYIVNGKKFVVK